MCIDVRADAFAGSVVHRSVSNMISAACVCMLGFAGAVVYDVYNMQKNRSTDLLKVGVIDGA